MKRANRHSIDVFFVLCLFLISTICLLGILFVGAKTYQKISSNSDDNFAMRTSLLYVTNKVNSFQEKGKIYTKKIDENDVLVFEETIDGISYTTQVYEYDGHLMELFAEKDIDLGLDAGTIITELSSFNIKSINKGLLEVSAESIQGKKGSVVISIV